MICWTITSKYPNVLKLQTPWQIYSNIRLFCFWQLKSSATWVCIYSEIVCVLWNGDKLDISCLFSKWRLCFAFSSSVYIYTPGQRFSCGWISAKKMQQVSGEPVWWRGPSFSDRLVLPGLKRGQTGDEGLPGKWALWGPAKVANLALPEWNLID